MSVLPSPALVAEPRHEPSWIVHEDVWPEHGPDWQSLTFWLRGPAGQGFCPWQRIAGLSPSRFTAEPGILAVRATVTPMRQSTGGLFHNLRQRWRKSSGPPTWVLPDGNRVQECGPRRTDALLVWAEHDAVRLDAAWVRTRWPESQEVRALGPRLLLVLGVAPPGPVDASELAGVEGCSRRLAEQRLAEAHRAGQSGPEITALTDLALILVNQNDAPAAVLLLDEALALVRAGNDPSALGDVLRGLGMALLSAGQPRRALAVLGEALEQARAAGDRFAELAVVERLGHARCGLGDLAGAVPWLEAARLLAHSLGQPWQEADLLWQLAMLHAELGRSAEAAAHGQAAVERMEQLHHPQAAVYADHLRRFVAGPVAASVAPAGLLKMAVSAATAAAGFVASGMKTVPARTLHQRLRTCLACPQHTGLRCRPCGCFTNAKARLPREACPLGKWPAVAE